jgi:hypothetical protein
VAKTSRMENVGATRQNGRVNQHNVIGKWLELPLSCVCHTRGGGTNERSGLVMRGGERTRRRDETSCQYDTAVRDILSVCYCC